ncbi:MAG: potassium-transporting ATPase subunit KdpC [Melioribacteraceae bacterium]
MKFIKEIKLHLVTVVLFGIMFPLAIWAVGLLFPHQANGLPIYKNAKLIGFENIGQKFTSDKYFWGRPSAVDYNAAATGGSNKGPTNEEYLALVEQRIKEFMEKNPGVKRSEIPSDLVTASGGGLDPHISVQGAIIQAARIASARGISIEKINQLVSDNTEKPLLGLFGTERINVLKLNIALDELKNN